MPLSEWNASRMQSFHVVCGAIAGQFSYVGVYNASKDSAYYVYGIDIAVTGGTSFITLETAFGNPGAEYIEAAGLVNIPADPRTPNLGLTPIFFNSALCVGQHAGGFSAPSNSTPAGAWHPSPFPLLIAPPGYSALLQTRNMNLTIEAGIFGTMIRGG